MEGIFFHNGVMWALKSARPTSFMFILEKVSGLGHHLTQGGNGTGFGVPVQSLPVTGVVISQMSFLSGPHLFHL